MKIPRLAPLTRATEFLCCVVSRARREQFIEHLLCDINVSYILPVLILITAP